MKHQRHINVWQQNHWLHGSLFMTQNSIPGFLNTLLMASFIATAVTVKGTKEICSPYSTQVAQHSGWQSTQVCLQLHGSLWHHKLKIGWGPSRPGLKNPLLGTFPDQRPLSTQQNGRASWRLRSQVCYVTSWKRSICNPSQWVLMPKWQMTKHIPATKLSEMKVWHEKNFAMALSQLKSYNKRMHEKKYLGVFWKDSSKECSLVVSRCFTVEQRRNQASKVWNEEMLLC